MLAYRKNQSTCVFIADCLNATYNFVRAFLPAHRVVKLGEIISFVCSGR